MSAGGRECAGGTVLGRLWASCRQTGMHAGLGGGWASDSAIWQVQIRGVHWEGWCPLTYGKGTNMPLKQGGSSLTCTAQMSLKGMRTKVLCQRFDSKAGFQEEV